MCTLVRWDTQCWLLDLLMKLLMKLPRALSQNLANCPIAHIGDGESALWWIWHSRCHRRGRSAQYQSSATNMSQNSLCWRVEQFWYRNFRNHLVKCFQQKFMGVTIRTYRNPHGDANTQSLFISQLPQKQAMKIQWGDPDVSWLGRMARRKYWMTYFLRFCWRPKMHLRWTPLDTVRNILLWVF